MLKDLIRNGLVTGIAIGALALAGCGQESGSGDGNGAGDSAPAGSGTVGTGADTGDDNTTGGAPAGGGADEASASDATEVGSTEFNDASAEGAIMTYVNRLKEGDFYGAAEVCLPEAPGTQKLLTLAEKFETDLAGTSEGELAMQFMINDFRQMEVSKTAAEDGVVVYEVSIPEKSPVNVRIERRDGVWRVIPPVNGTPLG